METPCPLIVAVHAALANDRWDDKMERVVASEWACTRGLHATTEARQWLGVHCAPDFKKPTQDRILHGDLRVV